MAAKKAFQINRSQATAKPEARGPGEKTPRERQYQLSAAQQSEGKKIVGYKLPKNLPRQVEAAAMVMTDAMQRKVWPAHIIEASVRAFLQLPPQKQKELLDT